MEQQTKCPECHTWNNSNDSICVKCGARLHPYAGEWWKNYNMSPVRLYHLKRSRKYGIWVFLCFYALVGFCVLAGYCALWIMFEQKYIVLHAIGLIISSCIIFLIVKYGICGFCLPFVAPNILRKKRKELLDDDFIEEYKKDPYVFVARGTGASHKFGLFDATEIKMAIPMIYDELTWVEKDKLLKGILNGIPVIIDVNNNNYN